MSEATWRKMITEEMTKRGEAWGDLLSSTISHKELDITFDRGFGGHEGVPFTLWTHRRVYFPAVYDGAEWVESVSRFPNGIATNHVGGE
jgi:hypothetical protein